MGRSFALKLNIGLRPIANKYREGKMKRTLERELKVPEIAEREANGTSSCFGLRLVLAKVNFSSARAVNLSWTSVLFLRSKCHRALGVRRKSLYDRVRAAVLLVLGWRSLP